MIKNIRDLYRGISDFKKGCQSRINIFKYVKGDLVADCYSIVARLRNYFSQLLNVHGIIDVRHTKIYTAETLVPGLNAFEFELVIEELICYKTPDQIPAK
jgi:hypothetical protein